MVRMVTPDREAAVSRLPPGHGIADGAAAHAGHHAVAAR
jgi:hypothetical protein